MIGIKGQGSEDKRRREKLRYGFTTGACAAAAAKAATMLLFKNIENLVSVPQVLCSEVEIPFPDGSRHKFKIQNSKFKIQDDTVIAFASVIKDAGDDPDVTNGTEICATVRIIEQQSNRAAEQQNHKTTALLPYCPTALAIKGGKGVGIVTKPGLLVPVGAAAINPLPRRMITEAVMEAILENSKWQVVSGKFKDPTPCTLHPAPYTLEVIISVPNGEELAKKTLNPRLGIIGGISILGTTGIVKPVSSEAWTATIISSMNVAKAMGHKEIVLSVGRTSEKAHIKKYHFPGECYILIGDYLEFSLLEGKKHGFTKIHLCAQWAKMLKIAMATPQTHVRHGAIDIKKAVAFLEGLGYKFNNPSSEFNTAKEIFDFINLQLTTYNSQLFSDVCSAAKRYAESITNGIIVIPYLVSYEGFIQNLDSCLCF